MSEFSGKPQVQCNKQCFNQLNHANVSTSQAPYPNQESGSRTVLQKVFKCHVMGHSNSLGVIGDSSTLPNTESPKVLKRRKASKQ